MLTFLRFRKLPHSYTEVLNQEVLPPCSFFFECATPPDVYLDPTARDKFYQAINITCSASSHKQQ